MQPKWFSQLSNRICKECDGQHYTDKDLSKHSMVCPKLDRGIICLSSSRDLVFKCEEGTLQGQTFPLNALPFFTFANGLEGNVVTEKDEDGNDKFHLKVGSKNFQIENGMIILFKEIGFWL